MIRASNGVRALLLAAAGATALAAAMGSAGCGDEATPTTPAAASMAGRWVGTLADRVAGTARLEVDLSGPGEILSGTFTLRLADGASVHGIVIGRTHEAPSYTLNFLVSSASRDCAGSGYAYRVRVVRVDSRLTGTYSPDIGCPVLSDGAVELTRQ